MGNVLLQDRGPVQWIEIARPKERNALNASVVQGIIQGIDQAEARQDARVIVLTGSGDRAFCAGGDLSPTADGAPFSVDPARPESYVVNLFRRMLGCEVPIIARVNGSVVAGGIGLLCACDLAVAVSGASFGTPESRIGLFPMMILPLMQRVLPRKHLLELCLTGELFPAHAALEMGLVNYVVDSDGLDAKVDWLISRLVDKSPTSLRLGRKTFRVMQDMGLEEAFEYAQLMLPMMASTEDAREGFAAFREKRKPCWRGN